MRKLMTHREEIQTPVTVKSAPEGNKRYYEIVIEQADKKIVIRHPQDIDDLIIDLIKARNLSWPWPKLNLEEL